jgi:hypothetical protein
MTDDIGDRFAHRLAAEIHTCTPQEPLWIRNREGKLELHAPPQREWQGLTDEEKEHYRRLGFVGVEIIETILKEKNYDKS